MRWTFFLVSEHRRQGDLSGRTDNKQRYSFNDDKSLIRANQGHSIPVDVELEQKTPVYMIPKMISNGGCVMTLKNKLGISDSVELAREEEKISKKRAIELFENRHLDQYVAGTYETLQETHRYLFDEIYDFAGKMRTVNIAKGSFRFVPLMYLNAALENIDRMPQSNFDEIVEKYVEMNIAHPFREGNGRSARIWLDHIFKKEIQKVVDWSLVDKEDYLLAMERSPVKDVEIKYLLEKALTTQIDDRDVFMKGIDHSYFYEGYHIYRAQDL